MGESPPHGLAGEVKPMRRLREGCMTVLSDDVGATLLKKGAPFADSAGRVSATIHDWCTGAACEIRKKAQKGLTEGLGTAFP